MEYISLLCPTRARPHNMECFVSSALNTADNPSLIEILFYIDSDDFLSQIKLADLNNLSDNIKVLIKDRKIASGSISMMTNSLIEIAKGPYYFGLGDDVIFRTKGWDTKIKNEFHKYPDRIVQVSPRDGKNDEIATHFVLHKNYIDCLGYMCPSFYVADYADLHRMSVSKEIERHVWLDDVLCEHMHYSWGKSQYDQTSMDKNNRAYNCPIPANVLYEQCADLRQEEVSKLRKFIEEFK